MTIEDKAQAYDTAIRKAQDIFHTSEFVKITDLFPELAESEDERIRKTLSVLVQNAIYPGLITEEDSKKCLAYLKKQKERGPLTKEEKYILHCIIEYLDDETCPSEWISLLRGIYCLPYGKQKESAEKEYVFRPLGGTDITVAAGQAIKRVNEGERLVLAFNGAYIPVLKGYDVNEIVDIYNTFVEKKKEPPFVKDVNVGYPGHYFYDGNRMYLCSSPALEEKQKEQKTTNELEDAFKYYTDRGITISCGDFKAEPKKERIGEYGECTDFTIYHPLKNGKGEYECIPYSFYGSLTSFSENKDLIDFLRTCFYTEEECNEWIEKQKEQNSVECIEFDNEFEKQVSHLLASVLNGEWEYNEDFVKYAAQSLLGYAKHELELDGKALLYTADKSYQIGFRDGVASVKPAEWSESDKGVLMDAICATDKLGNNEVYNKNNPNLAKAFRVAKDWLKNLPERFNLQPKQEWSEEDENIIKNLIELVDAEPYNNFYESSKDTILKWLKSIRPQSQGIYQQVVKRIRDICDRYEQNGMFTDERARDFLGNVRIKCKDAIECAPILDEPSWKPSEQEKGALRTAIHVLTEERNFPKAASQLQNILDAFNGKESRKDWKSSEEQMKALNALNCHGDLSYVGQQNQLISLYNDLKKLM